METLGILKTNGNPEHRGRWVSKTDRRITDRLPVQFVRPSVKSTSRNLDDDDTIKTTTKTTEILLAALPEEKMKYRK